MKVRLEYRIFSRGSHGKQWKRPSKFFNVGNFYFSTVFLSFQVLSLRDVTRTLLNCNYREDLWNTGELGNMVPFVFWAVFEEKVTKAGGLVKLLNAFFELEEMETN